MDTNGNGRLKLETRQTFFFYFKYFCVKALSVCLREPSVTRICGLHRRVVMFVVDG